MDLTARALIPIPIGKNSLFSPSSSANQTLVVFVHGFRGKALSTWLSFPDFFEEFDGLRNADALFYGYPSRPQRLQNMAISLRSHIDQIWDNPKKLGPAVSLILDERTKQTKWSRLLFIAHSLGAVVVRRALLDCYLESRCGYSDEHWSRNYSLCLFAPAHTGANSIELLGETFAILGVPIAPLIKHFYPCLQDIEINSQTIALLKDDYRDILESSKIHINASIVVLAENDLIVEPARFPGDPVPTQIEGRGHIEVCKPSGEFVDPVHKVCQIWEENHWLDRQQPSELAPYDG